MIGLIELVGLITSTGLIGLIQLSNDIRSIKSMNQIGLIRLITFIGFKTYNWELYCWLIQAFKFLFLIPLKLWYISDIASSFFSFSGASVSRIFSSNVVSKSLTDWKPDTGLVQNWIYWYNYCFPPFLPAVLMVVVVVAVFPVLEGAKLI